MDNARFEITWRPQCASERSAFRRHGSLWVTDGRTCIVTGGRLQGVLCMEVWPEGKPDQARWVDDNNIGSITDRRFVV